MSQAAQQMQKDPRLLVCKLLMGSAFTGVLPPATVPFTGIGTGMQVIADDGVTVLTPTSVVPVVGGSASPNSANQEAAVIQVKMQPYQQEEQGETPQVVVGPAKTIKRDRLNIGAAPVYWVQRQVEVRVIARDYYPGFGWKVDGRSLREQLVQSVVACVEANYADPDGTGTFNATWPTDDQDTEPVGKLNEGNPLMRTAVHIVIEYFENTPS